MMYEQRYPTSMGHVKVQYRREPNFLERLGSSLAGSVLGLLLLIGACVLLFWNEGRSVYTYNVIVEAESKCRAVGSADFSADHLHNELVYLTGQLSTQQAIVDSEYGVAERAARLRRRVEMYQWSQESRTEEHKERDGTIRTETHYSYTQKWSEHLISSASFDDVRYQNPREMLVSAVDLNADPVEVGLYTLSNDAIELITNWQAVVLNPHPNLQLHYNKLYHGNPSYPHVGDVRVWYEFAGSTRPGQADQVSVVARLSPGRVLTPYHSKVHPGYQILYLHMGRLSMEELFSQQHSSNTALTWGLRLLGLVLTCVGFNLISRIIVTLFDWVPVVRELVALSAFLLSLLLALSLTLVVVAVAWICYRPLYGAALLAGAVLPFLLPKLLPDKLRQRN